MNKSRTFQFPPGAVRVFRWNTADYLENLEDIAHYLEAAFEDGDSHLIAEALGNVARAHQIDVMDKMNWTDSGIYLNR